MAVINADGLFYGERLAKCSDLAQLWWPRFYHASNGFGRLEISFEEFNSTAMKNIRVKLSKNEFIGLIQEYHEHHLLFLYRVGRSLWGQWCGGEDNLPRYKSKADHRSPEPPAEPLRQYIEEYEQEKADSVLLQVFVNVAEGSAEVRKISQESGNVQKVSHGVGIGVGVGTGVGIGEELGKTESVSLSVSVRDSDEVAKEIAYAHPKLEHLAKHQKRVPDNIEKVIWMAVAQDGADLVLAGTRNLRDAVAKWPPGNERFIPNPLTFFSEFGYLKDPKEWERPAEIGTAKQREIKRGIDEAFS